MKTDCRQWVSQWRIIIVFYLHRLVDWLQQLLTDPDNQLPEPIDPGTDLPTGAGEVW
jgi:hypothetical protein